MTPILAGALTNTTIFGLPLLAIIAIWAGFDWAQRQNRQEEAQQRQNELLEEQNTLLKEQQPERKQTAAELNGKPPLSTDYSKL